MKGKKVTAAEKLYEGRMQELRKENSALTIRLKELEDKRSELLNENYRLTNENLTLIEQNGRLLYYTELSKDDIKKACERDKAAASLVSLIGAFPSGKFLL